MLQRFAAACMVASGLIALGAIASLFMALPAEGARTLTTVWLFVPLGWGVWAALAPASWVPNRLPHWGGLLGVIVGIMAGPVFNMPERLGGPPFARWTALVAGPVLYFLLWFAVRAVYRTLSGAGRAAA
jgi:hypothetical protein